MKHIHILGICGTFMGGVALLAREAGFRVSGSDASVYPPMSTLLAAQGIEVREGYDPAHLDPAPDCVVIGNALSRGNPAVEYVLDRGLSYTSGPQWLAENVLRDRWVLAVAGTHGKTTTSSLLAWILEYAGLAPGFLIGGVPENFGLSARFGKAPFFVVEADEYDTAFFDKRSKFVHYRPRTLVLNNLEYDHADIFPDLAAIERQFHHLVRTVPGNGLIVRNADSKSLDRVLAMGFWTRTEGFSVAVDHPHPGPLPEGEGDLMRRGELLLPDGGHTPSPSGRRGPEGPDEGEGAPVWRAELLSPDGNRFRVFCGNREAGTVEWSLVGRHNVANALAALAAARHVGVRVETAIEALKDFLGIRRRMTVHAEVHGVTIYDDFAHHPTAIDATIAGLRARVGDARIVAVLDPRSNTMRMGVLSEFLAPAMVRADVVIVHAPPEIGWDVRAAMAPLGNRAFVLPTVDAIIEGLSDTLRAGDHVLIMSNGGFGGLHARLAEALAGQVEKKG